MLELLGIETPNIAAGLRWWLATDRVADVLECFDRHAVLRRVRAPDPDARRAHAPSRAPPSTRRRLNDLRGFARRACSRASWRSCVGDIDDYRHDCSARERDRMRHRWPSPSSTPRGDVRGGHRARCRTRRVGVDLARAPSDAAARMAPRRTRGHGELSCRCRAVPWTSTIADMRAVTQARPKRRSRIAAACRARSFGCYPLSRPRSRPGRRPSGPGRLARLSAAEEIAALDHTQRRWWSTIAIGLGGGERPGIAVRRRDRTSSPSGERPSRDHDEHDERGSCSCLLLATVSESLVEVDPQLAIELAAIAESGAIAPSATFTVHPA